MVTLDLLVEMLISLGEFGHGLGRQVHESISQWGREASERQSELPTHPGSH